jgi:hypothetical protein
LAWPGGCSPAPRERDNAVALRAAAISCNRALPTLSGSPTDLFTMLAALIILACLIILVGTDQGDDGAV